MDSQLCLWRSGAVVCDSLMGHEASISKVMVDDRNVCVSASYDCILNVWDLNGVNQGSQMFGPHKNAVLDFAWENSLVVSGDKNGVVSFWVIFIKEKGY